MSTSPDVVRCPECGQPANPVTQQFCPHCGYPLIGMVPQADPQVTDQPGQAPYDPRTQDVEPTLPLPGVAQGDRPRQRCPDCGQLSDAKRVRCERCGRALRSAVTLEELPPAPSAPPPRTRWDWWSILIVVLGLLTAAILVWWLTGR